MGYLFNVLGVTEHANLHLRSRNVRKPHGTAEALVFLRIIVLQPDLKLHGFRKVTLLLFRVVHDLGNYLPKRIALKLTVIITPKEKINKYMNIYLDKHKTQR